MLGIKLPVLGASSPALPAWPFQEIVMVDPPIKEQDGSARHHDMLMHFHVSHGGILLLQAEWESCAGENPEAVYERFILFLAQRAGLPAL